MIFVSKAGMSVEGQKSDVLTEVALLLRELQSNDEDFLPAVLSSLYSDAGRNDLNKALGLFKTDTTKILKNLEKWETEKWK